MMTIRSHSNSIEYIAYIPLEHLNTMNINQYSSKENKKDCNYEKSMCMHCCQSLNNNVYVKGFQLSHILSCMTTDFVLSVRIFCVHNNFLCCKVNILYPAGSIATFCWHVVEKCNFQKINCIIISFVE